MVRLNEEQKDEGLSLTGDSHTLSSSWEVVLKVDITAHTSRPLHNCKDKICRIVLLQFLGPFLITSVTKFTNILHQKLLHLAGSSDCDVSL